MFVRIADTHLQTRLELSELLDVLHHGTATCQHDAGDKLVVGLGLLDLVVDQFKDFFQTSLDDMSQVLERDFLGLSTTDTGDGDHLIVAVFTSQS